MQEIYNFDVITEILNLFKVEKVIISGIKDDILITNIFNYNANFTQINTDEKNCIKENPLNILPNLEDYDAIFIDDDANWYTVFNELKNIKKSNVDFPLVFICNNNFPNKRRDSYSNPDKIPSKFRQRYANELPVKFNDKYIIINDGFYHACEENTPKNGVLTAIEDFLKENPHIGMMNITFIKEITLLYLKVPINQKRISIISKKIKNSMIYDINLSDKLVENHLLLSYIDKYSMYNEDLNNLEVEISKKDEIIDDYKNIIRNQNNEMDLKETQLNASESKLSLKDSQIKNIESKLVNKENRINNLESQLQSVTDELNSMTHELNSSVTL